MHVWIDVDGSGNACLETGAKPNDCPPPPNAPQASREIILPAYGRKAEPFHLTLKAR